MFCKGGLQIIAALYAKWIKNAAKMINGQMALIFSPNFASDQPMSPDVAMWTMATPAS